VKNFSFQVEENSREGPNNRDLTKYSEGKKNQFKMNNKTSGMNSSYSLSIVQLPSIVTCMKGTFQSQLLIGLTASTL
jgi:hypothetical protein